MELHDFEGAWSLDRVVRHDDGARASYAGRAAATPDGAGLRWREEGWLTLADGRRMAAHRTLLWRPGPGGVAVLFEDGCPFHRIDLTRADPGDEHLCAADLYRVSYDLSAWPVWRVRWRVDGPRHAYVSETRHAPLAGAAAMGHPDPA